MRKLIRGIQTISCCSNYTANKWRAHPTGQLSIMSSTNGVLLERPISLCLCSSKSYASTQQVRQYAPTAGQLSDELPRCWNCKRRSKRRGIMLCEACGHLQDVDPEVNYFELLNMPASFGVEQQELAKNFRQLQTLVHPDKYSNKTSREQSNSADWSALINKAYKTLSTPIERGKYLLGLQGQKLPQDNSSLDKAFLMEMMERNEEVDEAESKADLERLNERLISELNEQAKELRVMFDSNAIDAAKMCLVKMKYLLSVQKSIKKRLEALMGS